MNNYELLQRLCSANGISGDENSVREIIINEIKNYADYRVDNLGNIIARKKNAEKSAHKLMISAHIDEVGFIVTDITSDGLIKFDEVGGVDRRVLPGRTVYINNSVPGVIGVKPIHLCSSEECKSIPKLSDMYIDIGADSQKQAEEYVNLGDSVTFEPYYIDNDLTIRSKALDDRLGCFIMIEMIKSDYPFDTVFAFVVQEEVGLHGAKTAAFSVAPEFAIVLEATTAADVPDVEESKQVCSLGKGAVIGYMDRRTIYDKGLINKSIELSENGSIPMQFKRAVAGGNDAGAIHESRGGVRTLAISAPCRYLHAQISMINKSDVDSVYSLAKTLAESICGDKL